MQTLDIGYEPPARAQEPAVLTEADARRLMGQMTEHVNAYLKSQGITEAFTQADIELALDDRGWLVGGKRQYGELDPLSRQVQVNRSRYYWLRDPLAKQAVRLWTDYAFGAEAVTWKVEDESQDNGPKEDDSEEAGDDAPKAQAPNPQQAKINKFMADRQNRRCTSRKGMRRLSNKLLVDGELFLAFFADGTVRAIDCLQVTDFITDPDDDERVIAYKREVINKQGATTKTLYYKPWDLDEEDAALMVDPVGGKKFAYAPHVVVYHVPFDEMGLRGNPLLSSCADWAKEHRRFMVARVAIQQALSRFAFTTDVKGGQKVVDAMRSKLESTFAQTGLSGGTEHQPPNAPGGNFISNDGVELKAMPRVTGASDAKQDADGLKLMVSAGTGIMLHYFGDPSTGNLATASAMELPMLKMFGAYQQLWKDTWRDIFSIVLEEDADAEEREIITIEMPSILEDDLQKLGAFLTQVTTVFPEAKVPAVLEMCLTSMGVQNVQEVMDDIDERRDEIDAQNAQNREDSLAGKNVAVDPNTGKPVLSKTAQPGQPNLDDNGMQSESLVKALETLIEALR